MTTKVLESLKGREHPRFVDWVSRVLKMIDCMGCNVVGFRGHFIIFFI